MGISIQMVSNFRYANFGGISEVTLEEPGRAFTVETRGWLLRSRLMCIRLKGGRIYVE